MDLCFNWWANDMTEYSKGVNMKRLFNYVSVFMFLLSFVLFVNDAQARERRSSGSYQGRSTGGTYQKSVDKSRGSTTKKTTWQNERGQGRKTSQRGWDKDSGTGSYSSTVESARNKTLNRSGSVVKNEDGSFAQNGTITGPNGKTTTVDRDYTKNEDGSRSVDTVYTGEEGQTLEVDKDISYQDGVREVTGDYSTSTGKSGTFSGTTFFEDGKMVSDRSLTDQDDRTWSQNVVVGRDGNTINRDVTNTNPWGITKTFNQSVTIDEISVEK